MIQQGYMLRVTSWENDGDCYNTKEIQGLTETQARWLVRFCEQLAKQDQIPAHDVDFESWPLGTFPGFGGLEEQQLDQELAEEIAYELVGTGYENGLLRVCESWTVHYIPSRIEEIYL